MGVKRKSRRFDVVAAVLCDDVRTENTNKALLIGVYGGDVIVETIPTREVFSLWVNVTSNSDRDATFDFRVVDDMDATVQSLKKPGTMVQQARGEPLSLALGALPLAIARPGVLKFQLKFDDEDWQTILAKRFRLMQPEDLPSG